MNERWTPPPRGCKSELLSTRQWIRRRCVEGAEYGVERAIQMFTEILGEETQDMDAVFLEQGVLAAVAAVGGRVREVLGAIDLDGKLESSAEEIDFHFAPAVKGDWQLGIEPEEARCFC